MSTWSSFYACNQRVTVIKTAPAAPPPTFLPQHVVRVRIWNLHVFTPLKKPLPRVLTPKTQLSPRTRRLASVCCWESCDPRSLSDSECGGKVMQIQDPDLVPLSLALLSRTAHRRPAAAPRASRCGPGLRHAAHGGLCCIMDAAKRTTVLRRYCCSKVE